ncbi:MAG TPA: serine/threonine-protein kinase [Polyangiaceae bacterium]
MVEAPAPHMRLGAYEPLLQLATGGMATVYVARQIGAAGFERLVVVKRVHPHLLSNREFYDMFRDEARLAAMLHHSNVVAVTDVVESDGELFLVMEYVDSVALSTLLKTAADKRERLPPAVVVRILLDALSGLHAAHEAVDMRGNRLEIVHRDVSPQNVIVGSDGASRLIDFGVAKARHRLTETKSGSLKGKYGYMSPEQAKAQPIDRRADLFSAGVVLWETLTGSRLFRGENEFDTIRRITEEPVPAPSTIAPTVPRGVDAVALKALSRDRAARFQTAHEFIEALEAACLPAPTRDVGAIIKRLCGDRLDSRRSTLHDMLEGRIAPLSVTRVSVVPDGESTNPSAPTSKRRLLLRRAGDEGTDGQIAATHDAFAPRRLSRRTAWIAASLAVAVAAIIFMGSMASRRSMPSPQAASSASASAPAPTQTVAADEVVLELTAEAPIESVRALGMRDVRVRGPRARLVVARWGGELGIDAVLEGGTPAHAVALSDGPRDIVLVPAITAVVSAPRPPEPRPAGHSRTGGGPATPQPQSPGAPTPELQSNPYGP